MTISMGVAEPPGQGIEPAQVIQAADKALYRAKRSGRNRIEFTGNIRSRAKRSIA